MNGIVCLGASVLPPFFKAGAYETGKSKNQRLTAALDLEWSTNHLVLNQPHSDAFTVERLSLAHPAHVVESIALHTGTQDNNVRQYQSSQFRKG